MTGLTDWCSGRRVSTATPCEPLAELSAGEPEEVTR